MARNLNNWGQVLKSPARLGERVSRRGSPSSTVIPAIIGTGCDRSWEREKGIRCAKTNLQRRLTLLACDRTFHASRIEGDLESAPERFCLRVCHPTGGPLSRSCGGEPREG